MTLPPALRVLLAIVVAVLGVVVLLAPAGVELRAVDGAALIVTAAALVV